MNDETLLHDLIVDFLRKRLSREYDDVKINPSSNPDIVLSNHGLAVAIVQVETEGSISPEKAKVWKGLLKEGVRFILMVPKNSRLKVTELLWQNDLAGRISVGTYEILINLP